MPPARLTASLLLGAFCLTGLAQTATPPSPPPLGAVSKEEAEDAEIIVLAGLPHLKEKEAILSYARQTYVKADLIKDKTLLQIIRLSLSIQRRRPLPTTSTTTNDVIQYILQALFVDGVMLNNFTIQS